MSTRLLPPNATTFERDLEQAMARLAAMPVPLRVLWDADLCPLALLPWLAWALSVDTWDDAWPEAVKRARVREAIAIQRLKGTRAAIEKIVAVFGGSIAIREWFEADPPGDPHTFDLVLSLPGTGGEPPAPELVEQVIDEISRAKPARSHFTFAQALTARRASASRPPPAPSSARASPAPHRPEGFPVAGIELIVTNAGRAKIAAAIAASTTVTITECGISGVAITPSPTTTVLTGEAKRIAGVSGAAVGSDTVHMVVRDESTDVLTVRSLALYLADGTLFASYGQPTPLIEKTTSSMLLLQIDTIFANIDATVITFGNANFLNPPATTTVAGVVELATSAEAETGTDTVRAVTPKAAADTFVKKSGSTMSGTLTLPSAQFPAGASNWTAGGGGDSSFNIRLNGGAPSLSINVLGRTSVGGATSGYQFTATPGVGAGGVRVETTGGSRSTPAVNLVDGGVNMVATASGGDGLGWLGTFSAHPLAICVANAELARFGTNISLNPQGGTLTSAGNLIWHAGNDGAGSGLDADLLDGRQASEFALLTGAAFTGVVSITAAQYPFLTLARSGVGNWHVGGSGVAGDNGFHIRLNTETPYFSIGTGGAITIAGNTNWHAGNDGAGSGLDADLLDGVDSTAFLRRDATPLTPGGNTTAMPTASADGYQAPIVLREVNRAGAGSGALTQAPRITWHWAGRAGCQLLMRSDGALAAYDENQVNFRSGYFADLWSNSTKVWAASNDGAGSGLDADLLDGSEGSVFARWAGGSSYTGAIVLNYATPTITFVNPGQATWSFSGVGTGFRLQLQGAVDEAIAIDNGNFVTFGASIRKKNSGKYLHWAGADLTGDSITASADVPTGGADGDVHLQWFESAPVRTWIKIAGVWR